MSNTLVHETDDRDSTTDGAFSLSKIGVLSGNINVNIVYHATSNLSYQTYPDIDFAGT